MVKSDEWLTVAHVASRFMKPSSYIFRKYNLVFSENTRFQFFSKKSRYHILSCKFESRHFTSPIDPCMTCFKMQCIQQNRDRDLAFVAVCFSG